MNNRLLLWIALTTVGLLIASWNIVQHGDEIRNLQYRVHRLECITHDTPVSTCTDVR